MNNHTRAKEPLQEVMQAAVAATAVITLLSQLGVHRTKKQLVLSELVVCDENGLCYWGIKKQEG